MKSIVITYEKERIDDQFFSTTALADTPFNLFQGAELTHQNGTRGTGGESLERRTEVENGVLVNRISDPIPSPDGQTFFSSALLFNASDTITFSPLDYTKNAKGQVARAIENGKLVLKIENLTSSGEQVERRLNENHPTDYIQADE